MKKIEPWDEVQVSLGLKTREEVPIRRFTLREMSDALGIEQPVSEPRGLLRQRVQQVRKKALRKVKARVDEYGERPTWIIQYFIYFCSSF